MNLPAPGAQDPRSAAELLEAARQEMFSGQTDRLSPMTRLGQLALERARADGDAETEACALFYAGHHPVLPLAPAAAEARLAAAERRCRELGQPRALWALQITRANQYYLQRRYMEAIGLLGQLEQEHGDELAPLERVAVAHVMGYACKWCGRFDDLLDHAHRALPLADASGYRHARAAVRANLASNLNSIAFDPEAALPLLAQARELLAAAPLVPAWMQCLASTIGALDMLGRHEEAYRAWLRDSARPGALDDACATAATTVLALIGVGRLDEAQDRLGPPPAGGAHENHWQRAQQHQFARMRLLCARGAYAQACELAEAELGQVRSHACEPLYELRMYDCLRQARSALGDAAGALRAAVKARQACIPVLRLSSRARYLAAQLQAGGAAALSAIDLQRLDAVDQAVRAQPEPPPVPPPQPPRHPPEAPPEAPPGPPGPRVPPFVAHVVHELRTPIGGVVGMASLLMMSGLDEKQRRYAKLMQGSAQTLMLLVNDILDLAKLERGQFTLDPREADFGAWIGATLDPFVELAALKGLRLDSSVDAGLPARLVFDELRLRQVVSNLLSNAVKFTRRGGVRLDVARRAVAPNGRVGLRFEVADTGVGLTAEALGRLFQEFVQADASVAREHGGSGLGLALSKQLVERMGGRIGGESEPGVGSRFWFEVDLAAAAPVACIEAAAAR